ncbi:MAG: hypothetical protein JWM37_128 [Candidatus Saccharibacteria bacterium]|nr:hypothetical protein [Candidatus Saccharibacteria bacterium]
MLKQLQKRNEGFTIIEVLIVLAIAGLIMVVVFIAVPNLQRNARNNRIQTEANGLVTAYSEVSNNKGGQILTSTDVAAIKAAANNDTNSTIQTVTVTAGAGTTTVADTMSAQFFTKAKCDVDITNGKTVAGTTRTAALIYAKLSNDATGYVKQCVNI